MDLQKDNFSLLTETSPLLDVVTNLYRTAQKRSGNCCLL